MNIGLSSACFYPYVLTENSISLMKGYGFELGEIFLNTPSEYEYDFIQRLNEEKIKHSFEINSVHAFCGPYEPFLFDRYERRRKDMFLYYKAVCKACKILEAQCYTFHGMRYTEFPSLDKKFIIDIYNELLYVAAEEGVKLALENVSWCMSSDLEFLMFLKENCRYPIYFTFDIKQSYKANISPEKYIEIMGKDLINLHLNDRDDNHVCLLPGKGNVNYYSIKEMLKEVEYNGNGVIEVYRENFDNKEDIINSKKFLNTIL